MRSGGFYAKFAVDSMKKNSRYYVPYMLTCVLMTAMYYIIVALLSSAGLYDTVGGGTTALFLQFGSWVIVIFSLIFLFYTNNFIMKRRKREFGLYNVLGMGKRHIGMILFMETLFVFLVSTVLGIAAGALLNKLALLVMVKLLETDIPLGFSVSFFAVSRTVCLYGAVFLILFLNGVRQIHFTNAITMLRSETMGEREPKTKLFLAIFGLICLAGGYYISVTTKNPIMAFTIFFVAVILVIIGTYCLFIAGSISLLKTMRKRKSYYYKTKHFISVSGMIYRMKQNAASLASICVLSTMVLVTVSGTLALYAGIDDELKYQWPRQVNLEMNVFSDEINQLPVERSIEILDGMAEEAGVEVKNRVKVTYVAYGVIETEYGVFATDEEYQYTGNDICAMVLVPVEDYNAMTGENLTLDSRDEAYVYVSEGGPYSRDTLELMDMSFQVRGTIDDVPEQTIFSKMSIKNVILVVRDMDVLREAYHAEENSLGYSSGMETYYGFDVDDKEKGIDLAMDCADPILQMVRDEDMGQYDSFYFDNTSRDAQRASYVEMFAGLFFVGLFLSSIFLMATILIIYYKQISEGLQDARRFEIMQKVGLSDREIRRSIRDQVLIVFFLPLVTAGIHTAFSFPIISRSLQLLGMTNIWLFIGCMAGCFLVFAAIYVIVYLVTAKSYYRIVRKGE